MKFMSLSAFALLIASTEAANINRHNIKGVTFLQTLPDVRSDTVNEKDIVAHEKARSDAAKVKKNPQSSLLESMRTDLEAINHEISFGVSFSQNNRNNRGRALCKKVGGAVKEYANKLIDVVEKQPNEALTEQNAHNIASMIFHDVQLEDSMKELGMDEDKELQLAVNRLKSLQKLYLFEQKGGENYLE